MIPKVCANCEHCTMLVLETNQVAAADCTRDPMWMRVEDPTRHFCASFDMVAAPRYVVSDEPGPAVQAFDDMMGNPMEQVDDLIEVEQ